jgi:multicomponent Na+:H+ antiporter subunit D
MPSLPPAVVFLAGAAVLPVLPRRAQSAVLLVTPVAALALIAGLEPGATLAAELFAYEVTPLRADGLAVAFGVVFALMAFLGSLYGLRLTSTGERVATLLYAGSAVGVVFAGDLLTLFVLWEIKAVASVFLVWARRTPASAGAGTRYLFVHLFGGTVLLGGILVHLAATGSLAFTAFEPGPAAWLILFGFALSAAVPPLHAWLADAYPEGTIGGTVLLAAFTTKAGVYALARGFAGYELLVWAGVVMALYGVVYAVLENDIRRLLAYHIVSQVGYMVTAVGMGGEGGVNAATAHAFAHILYKGLLLMGAGAVLYATGRSKLTELGGLARAMPAVLVLYLIGAFSISGVPLFSGFVSKELVVHAAATDGREAVFYLLKIASVGTFLHTGLKLPWFTWAGPARDVKVAPIPVSMYTAMGLTAGLNIAIGVVPGPFYELLPFAVDYTPYTAVKVVDTMQLLAFTALGFWLLVRKLGGEPTITLDTDWAYRSVPRMVAPHLPAAGGALAWAGEPLARPLRRFRDTPSAARPWPVASPGAPWPLWVLGVVVLTTFVFALGWSLLS